MSLLTFIHHLLNPHCPDCRLERVEQREESKVCQSCETLIRQLEIANNEKELLLERLLKEPEVITHQEPAKFTPPKQIPWALRRQMLETEDRRRAQLMKQAPKADVIKQNDINSLEKELGVVNDVVENQEAENQDTQAQG